MSDEPLTNAAVELMRARILFRNEVERDEFASRHVSDDFVFDDRRSGFNYGLLDAGDLPGNLVRSGHCVGISRAVPLRGSAPG